MEKIYTYENSINPWIMDPKEQSSIDEIITIDDKKITAKYLWELNSIEREKVLYKVFNYYRKNGFPYEKLSKEYIINQFKKLKKYDTTKILNSEHCLSNYGNLCLDVCRYFNNDLFYKSKGDKDTLSIEEVFYNDELFINSLKNRMGWKTTKEDGVERPFLFAISDKQILNGIRNSGLGYGVSNFRPTIAKFIFEKYLSNIKNPLIYDYSAGWGARALAAMSLNYNYISTDPLTSNNINKIIEFFKENKCIDGYYKCYNTGSETEWLKENKILLNSVDMCFSCPPYFTLERYSNNKSQCYNAYDNFNDWINEYWLKTVINCKNLLKEEGLFGLVIKEKYNKYELKEEMNKKIIENNFVLEDTYQLITSKNHLSGKKKSGEKVKNNEYILIYKKI